MRFGFIHRVLSTALVALGVMAIVSTGFTSPVMSAVVLGALALAMIVPEKWQGHVRLRRLFNVGALAILFLQMMRLFMGTSPLDIVVESMLGIQILRLATRRGAAHDPILLVLALFNFAAGTILGGGLAYAACFFLFLIIVPGAMVLSHLRREVEGNYRQGARDRTGLPVDVPRILRSRRVVGKGFLLSTCLMSIPILLFTSLLFLMFPRVGLSVFLLNHQRSGRMVGFSDHVDLGQVGVLRSDPSLALRFEPQDLPAAPPPRMVLRLRGTAFDTYDGRAWSRSQDRKPQTMMIDGHDRYALKSRAVIPTDTRLSFDLEPIEPTVVFLPSSSVALELKSVRTTGALNGEPIGFQRGAEGEVRYSGGDGRGIRYDVYVPKAGEVVAETLDDRARYLTLAAGFPERIQTLAREWTAGIESPFQKAKAIEEHLKNNFRYDLASPSAGTLQPIDHFLFESKAGHCEFFSSTMAVLLREVGVPSRNVTGFVGGSYNRFGRYYAVRQGDAHSWVEAFIDDPQSPGRGVWMTFDPTPTAAAQPQSDNAGPFAYMRDLLEATSQRWNHHVLGYDLRTQIKAASWMKAKADRILEFTGLRKGSAGRWWRLLATLAAFAAAYWLARKYLFLDGEKTSDEKQPDAKTARQQTISLYRELEETLTALGHPRPVHVTPLKHASELADKSYGTEIMDLTEVYMSARFGDRTLTAAELEQFHARITRLRQPTA